MKNKEKPKRKNTAGSPTDALDTEEGEKNEDLNDDSDFDSEESDS